MQRRGSGDEVVFEEDDDPVSGETVMAFYPGIGQSPGLRAAHFADPAFCSNVRCTIPTIVGADFASRQRLEVGDRYQLRMETFIVTARVVQIAELSPHAAPRRPAVHRRRLRRALPQWAPLRDLRPSVTPTEAWLDLSDDPEQRALTKEELSRPRYSLGTFFDRTERLEDSGSDPLTTAGGSGILLVAFIAISLLLALAFLVSMAVSARQRRLEMALLRTVGVGNLSILIQLFLEYAIIVGSGLALGVLLGNRISSLLLAYLEIDETGPHRPAALPGRNRLADSGHRLRRAGRRADRRSRSNLALVPKAGTQPRAQADELNPPQRAAARPPASEVGDEEGGGGEG